jgi:hypothetical protein
LTGSTETVSITTTGSLTNVVYEVTPTFNWSLVCGNATNSIGSSTHTIYVTYADPIAAGGSLTQLRLDKVIGSPPAQPGASGQSTVLGVAGAIYPLNGGTFNGATGRIAVNFAGPGCPTSCPDVGDPTNNWYMYSGVSDNWDIEGSCIAFATLNNMELEILGIANGTPVYIRPIPTTNYCSTIEQASGGLSSFISTNIACAATNYTAYMNYCAGNGGNFFEGTLKVVDVNATNYYAGASSFVGTRPFSILNHVASYEFWLWYPLLPPTNCYTTVCGSAGTGPSTIPVPGCP